MPLHRRFGERGQLPYWEDCGFVDDGLTERQAYLAYLAGLPAPEAGEDDLDAVCPGFEALSPTDQAAVARAILSDDEIDYLLELIDPHFRV